MFKIAHVALSVSNIEKSAAFYRRHFGFSCAEKYFHKEIGLTIAVLKKGDMALELFEFKRHKSLPIYRKSLDSDLKTLGTKHFSFAVSDIESWYKKLKKSKVKFATSLSTFDNGLQYFFIKDPDGILIEIIEKTGGRSPI